MNHNYANKLADQLKKENREGVLEQLLLSTVFKIPLNGCLFGERLEDAPTIVNKYNLRGDRLNLPYPKMVIEFQRDESSIQKGTFMGVDTIAYNAIVMLLVDHGESINTVVFYRTRLDRWNIANFGFTLIKSDGSISPLFVGKNSRDIFDSDKTVFVNDTINEVLALLEFLACVNCGNIKEQEVTPPAKLNKKRVKSGKLPFLTYKVLTLTNNVSVNGDSKQGAKGNALRTHLRRGHIRRLKSGKTTWVNSCVVKGSAEGVVVKDYAVGA